MSLLELGALGEFLGSLAVIASLLYLARQIRQNTESTKAIGYQTWQTNSTAHWLAFAESPHLGESFLGAMTDSRALTDVSAMQIGTFLLNNFRQYQMTYWLHEQDVINRDPFMVEMRMAAKNMEFPRIRQWWDAGGRNQMDPEFSQFIEEIDPGTHTNWAWTEETGYVSIDDLPMPPPDAGGEPSGVEGG